MSNIIPAYTAPAAPLHEQASSAMGPMQQSAMPASQVGNPVRRSQPLHLNWLPLAIVPYRELENRYRHIFANQDISKLDQGTGHRSFGRVLDVDMDYLKVINTTTDGVARIGTIGLATCIAVCARGVNKQNQTLLGLCHSSTQPAAKILSAVSNQMRQSGAVSMQLYLIGGMVCDPRDDAGCLDQEHALLSHHAQYNIVGARLHLSKGERDASGRANSVDVVLSEVDIFYSKKALFEPIEHDAIGAARSVYLDPFNGNAHFDH